MISRRIYLDYASLTPIDRRVVREMGKYSSPKYANPSSLYKEGLAAKTALGLMRRTVAENLHAQADEIVFTAGGTEANALALDGSVRAARARGVSKPHIIISAIEHSSIQETATTLSHYGCEVTRLPVDSQGLIALDELNKALRPETIIVSVMTVNNEIGSRQPIKEVAKAIRQFRSLQKRPESTPIWPYPLFHTDAAQAFLTDEVYVEKIGVDLLTLDGSKMYGPRGIGCLYVKRDVPISAIIHGGGQEENLRSGTENLPAIAGFARAISLAHDGREKESARLFDLKERFFGLLREIIPDIKVNGGVGMLASPHILNVSIPGIDNEFFMFQLDARGVACSTKSSCLRDEDESYVLRAIGAKDSQAIRFSFGRSTTFGELRRVVKIIEKIISTTNY